MDQTDKSWYGGEPNIDSPEWENSYYVSRLTNKELLEVRKAFGAGKKSLTGELKAELKRRGK